MHGRWRVVVAAAALGLAWACAVAGPNQCQDASECTLSGVAGQCTTDGHCVYPDDACASGYAHPQGAPDGLAGMCADVEVASDTGEPGDTGGPDPTMASDAPASSSDDDADDTGADTRMAVEDSDGDNTDSATDDEGMTTDATDESTGRSGCSDPAVVLLPAVDDTFFAIGCGVVGCQQFNYGATPGRFVFRTDNAESMMAARFDTSVIPFNVVLEASLVIQLDSKGDVELEVASIPSAYAWGEGSHDASPAADGESSYEHVACPDSAWPMGGPRSAAGEVLGSSSTGNAMGGALTIPLDLSAFQETLEAGANSVLLYAPEASGGMGGGATFVFTSEAMAGPVLHVTGC